MFRSAVVVDIFHFLPQMLVEGDIVAVLRQLRRDAHGYLVHLIVAVGGEQGEKRVKHSVEHLAGIVEGDNGVVKRRLRALIGDSVDFLLGKADAGIHGFLIITFVQTVKRHHVVGRLKLLKEDIFSVNHQWCCK